MAVTKIEVWNRALDMIGVRRLESLTIDREARYALDSAHDFVLQMCLEQGMWEFAMHTTALSPTISPSLDYNMGNAFLAPTNLVHTYLLGTNKEFSPPLKDAVEADGYFYARNNLLYIRYVSNDVTTGGGNLTRWTNIFAHYFVSELAAYVAFQLTRSEDIAMMAMKVAVARLSQARATDSMLASVGLMPYNALVRRELVAGGNVPEISTPFPSTEVTEA